MSIGLNRNRSMPPLYTCWKATAFTSDILGLGPSNGGWGAFGVIDGAGLGKIVDLLVYELVLGSVKLGLDIFRSS